MKRKCSNESIYNNYNNKNIYGKNFIHLKTNNTKGIK